MADRWPETGAGRADPTKTLTKEEGEEEGKGFDTHLLLPKDSARTSTNINFSTSSATATTTTILPAEWLSAWITHCKDESAVEGVVVDGDGGVGIGGESGPVGG